MSATETLAAVLATLAGLAAIVVDQLSADAVWGDAPLIAAAAGAVTVGFAVLLFGGAVPRAKARSAEDGHAAEAALVTSTIGFLSVASAWTGLPFVLGTGGAMLGTAAHRGASEPRQRGLATLAVALGAGAVALGCLVVVAL